MVANEVIVLDLEGKSEVDLRVPGMPMGTGWLPDGRMLIVSARDGRLLRREPGGSVVLHADLAGLSAHPWSDMVVDGRGNAYLGNIGFDFPVESSRRGRSRWCGRMGRSGWSPMGWRSRTGWR